jgi:predicted nucleic acid-binding protein
MAGRVLNDASPLTGLARVDGLPWLQALFGTVWVPQEVQREVLPGRNLFDDFVPLGKVAVQWVTLVVKIWGLSCAWRLWATMRFS